MHAALVEERFLLRNGGKKRKKGARKVQEGCRCFGAGRAAGPSCQGNSKTIPAPCEDQADTRKWV